MTQFPFKSRLAERVREALRAELRRGRWTDELPSERHLSAEFEVGRPTLHLALRSLEDEGLLRFRRGRPWEVLQRPPPPPQTDQRRPEVVIIRNAQLKPDVTSVLPLIDTLRHHLHRLGLDLVVVDALVQGAKNLDKTLADIEAEHRAGFYFLLSVPADVHRWFQRRGLQAVILGSRPPDVTLPAIEFESMVTMQHAVQYLIRRGHRRIGLLMHNIVAVGDAADSDIFFKTCAARSSAGVEGIRQTCVARAPAVNSAARKLLTCAAPPTAVIVTDLELVIGLYATAAELGRRIPRDLSVVSINYAPILDYLSPAPTCYQFPWEKMAARAIRILSDFQRLGVWPRKFYGLLPTLREGQSVRSLS